MRIHFAARIPLLLAALIRPAMAEESSTSVSAAAHDDRGFLVHTIKSPFQAGNTQIRVLLPEQLEPNEKLPVIYVLPVEAANENRYGDGLLEIKRNELHNKHRTIFVAPTFSHLPWYADHPTDPEIRQETYLLDVVVPLIDRPYPEV